MFKALGNCAANLVRLDVTYWKNEGDAAPPICEEDAAHLARCTKLRKVRLDQRPAEEVEQMLAAALPECEFEWLRG